MSVRPGDDREQAWWARGAAAVAGVDEVGRGAWAGPVTVGVAVVPAGVPAPDGLRDSKLLSEPAREAIFDTVADWCPAWAVGHAGPGECDRLGMTAALSLAANRAIDALDRRPDAVLLDGPRDYLSVPGRPGPPVEPVVGGDRSCVAMAAASVLAKVVRDRMMRELADQFPAFDFHVNKGYPSPAHRRALAGWGLTSIHRRSWSYVDGLPFR